MASFVCVYPREVWSSKIILKIQCGNYWKVLQLFTWSFLLLFQGCLKKKNMEYPIHFFATFPRNFIKTVTDWGEVPWLSKDFCSCYKIIRHERSMLFIAWLVFFLSFSFRSWDEGAKCSLPEVHRKKRWLFMPQVIVWDIHEVKNSLNSFLLVTLW